MIERNVALKAAKFVGKNLVLDFAYWPIWWYSSGLMEALKNLWHSSIRANQELALLVWMRNIFTPMFGDFTWEGRIISFLMRVVQIIGRGIMFILMVLFALIQLLLWIALPLIVIYEVLFNLNLWFL